MTKTDKNGRPIITNEESYLKNGRPTNLFKTAFSDKNLESLYRSSSLHQRRGALRCFLLTAIFYDIFQFFSPETKFLGRGIALVMLGVNILLLIWAEKGTKARNVLWSILPQAAWAVAVGQLLAQLFVKWVDVTPRDHMGWLLLFIYLHFATLPLRLPFCFLLAFITMILYGGTVFMLGRMFNVMPQIEVLVSFWVLAGNKSGSVGTVVKLSRVLWSSVENWAFRTDFLKRLKLRTCYEKWSFWSQSGMWANIYFFSEKLKVIWLRPSLIFLQKGFCCVHIYFCLFLKKIYIFSHLKKV